jgi:hypothetical protein
MEERYMNRLKQLFMSVLFGVVLVTPALWAEKFEEARIFIEYNSTDNDLGFHVFLDGEDWKTLKILNPAGNTIFAVQGKAGYRQLGLTELFFEGAEPSLDDFPLQNLLALFPEGRYEFVGTTIDGDSIARKARLSHAVPSGPSVSANVGDDKVVIRWESVDGPPPGFPQRNVVIVEYQIIVESFRVNLPATENKVTLPREFVQSLEPGEHEFEVLAIDQSGNQTITSDSFELE